MALADPTPAHLPLPGGREDARVRLHPLLTGVAAMADAWLHRREGRLMMARAYGLGAKYVKLPVPAFLVEHPGAGPVLVDTGWHSSIAVDPKKNLGRLPAAVVRGIGQEPGQDVPAQLRERGYEARDIKHVVMTHLHPDHASAICDFPDATFILDEREWEAANAPRGLTRGYLKRLFDHGFDYRTLDFSQADSFATFGSGIDLFGDGSIHLVSTPGHTLGHLSVVLRLKNHEALIAGDAIYDMATLLGTEPITAVTADEHRFRRSLRELQIYAKETPEALIIPGHDFGAWNELSDFYE
ncbi:MAG: N-acyl homoserine lactonase family protein [Thermoleophilaceae bacterium]|nr:N-acyl homoserine lactonase family protein [Thermoleophilaceae bacterium]